MNRQSNNMKANKYLVDFDTQLSSDKQTLLLLRNNEVFEVKEGSEANRFFKLLHKIEELKSFGFAYCFLEYDGIIDEWYQLNLVEPSERCEGVTLMYYPDRDLFEIDENGVQFTEMVKVESMIKAFKV